MQTLKNLFIAGTFLSAATPVLATYDHDPYRTSCNVDQGNVTVEVVTHDAEVELDGKYVINVFDYRGNRYTKHKIKDQILVDRYSQKVVWQQFVGYQADRCEVNWKSSLTAHLPQPAPVVVHHYDYTPRPQVVVHRHTYPMSRVVVHKPYPRKKVIVHKYPRRHRSETIVVHKKPRHRVKVRQHRQTKVTVKPHIKVSF